MFLTILRWPLKNSTLFMLGFFFYEICTLWRVGKFISKWKLRKSTWWRGDSVDYKRRKQESKWGEYFVENQRKEQSHPASRVRKSWNRFGGGGLRTDSQNRECTTRTRVPEIHSKSLYCKLIRQQIHVDFLCRVQCTLAYSVNVCFANSL